MHLSADAIAAYRHDGFYFPIRVFSAARAQHYRYCLERHEASAGGPIGGNTRHKVHLLFTWAAELIREPAILDAVESLIGPDIVCWTTNFFIKPANDPSFVSWHQDSTYWGLDPVDDVVTAWVALSDAPVASGAMRFIPGSQRRGQIAHVDTFHEHNLLTRGQELAVQVDERLAVDVPLHAGEMSLHHIRLIHGSKPNTTENRRIGLAIRYIPTSVRQVKVRDSATLVRGVDRYDHFDWEPAPTADLDPAALAAHRDALARQVAALYEGTDKTEMRR
ncbi:MAG: phytanoyl-CoA dioxygenase family protein [Alphaproteobacteria bacterium]|nr:phytanoyl-CoA dioxygenase family protein [Alphaproteobacteria bacterium]